MTHGYVLLVELITRRDALRHPDTVFVFGDNMSRLGRGGLAKQLRSVTNAVGVPTKWGPYRNIGAFFKNVDWYNEQVKWAIEDAFSILERVLSRGQHVVMPKQPLGSGLAQLPSRAPEFYQKLCDRRTKLITYSKHLAISSPTVDEAFAKLDALVTNDAS